MDIGGKQRVTLGDMTFDAFVTDVVWDGPQISKIGTMGMGDVEAFSPGLCDPGTITVTYKLTGMPCHRGVCKEPQRKKPRPLMRKHHNGPPGTTAPHRHQTAKRRHSEGRWARTKRLKAWFGRVVCCMSPEVSPMTGRKGFIIGRAD